MHLCDVANVWLVFVGQCGDNYIPSPSCFAPERQYQCCATEWDIYRVISINLKRWGRGVWTNVGGGVNVREAHICIKNINQYENTR